MTKRLNRALALAAAGLYCIINAPHTLADTADSENSGQVQSAAESPEQGEGDRKFNDFVTLGGLIEVDAIVAEDFAGTDTSDFDLATMELILDAKTTEWANGHVVVAYDSDDDDLYLDEANITLGKIDEFPLFLTAGKVYAPFGDFCTNMLQDPLTLTVGEINATGVIGGFETNGITGSLFAFEGMNETGDDDTINGFGASLAYTYEQDETAFNTGISWVSNIADADETTDVLEEAGIDTISSQVGGLSMHLVAKYGAYSLVGEYTMALDSFDAAELAFGDNGAEPAAWNSELAYTTELWAKESVFAVGYQQSREALSLGMPEQRFITSASMTIFTGTTLSLEYYLDQDYSAADGGTDGDGYGFTTRLAYEF